MREVDIGIDMSYTALFKERAARSATGIAGSGLGKELTYAELERRSNQLAHHLIGQGVGAEKVVAVCLERSLEMLITLLGVWKAGGAYVPLDPEYPRERLAYMLSDSAPSLLITQDRFVDIFANSGCKFICLDAGAVEEALRKAPEDSPENACSSENLAYVIYTSGSTGKPKGVEITHASVLNHSVAVSEIYALGPGDRVLQFAPLSFDISVEEIFPTWLSGGTVVLRTEEAVSSIGRFLELVAQEGITVLNLPTAYWHEVVEELGRTPLPSSVRLVVIGGEKASEAVYARWKQAAGPSVRLINTYGPTETTVIATVYEADPGQAILPIGRPIRNTEILVLDENMQMVEEEGSGELYIGGIGLARGYRNEPELTASRFIKNPHWPMMSSERLYRTGDRVRLLPDGNLEFVGRVDNQIKLRGYRIEPGEIEAALLNHPAIKEAVVAAREMPAGGKRLVAYVVPRPGCRWNTTELMKFLRSKLAAYMIPSIYVSLSSFPLTPAGKIDRAALPEPSTERPDLKEDLVLPRNDLEQRLAGIWREVLQVKEVGAKDSFFDLGGDSLLAGRVIARVQEFFGVEVSQAKLFEAGTIEALAVEVSELQKAPTRAAKVRLRRYPRQGDLPASYIQEQLWVLHELDPESDAYNMAAAFRISGPLNVSALERALNEVVKRHESLRTCFEYNESGVVQRIAASVRVNISIHGASASAQNEETEVKRFLEGQIREPFDLGKAPLLRASLLRLRESDQVLAVVMHHAISDGWSQEIFFNELAQQYEALARKSAPPRLAELPLQYADFACWQREALNGSCLESELDYWKQELAGAPEEVKMPIEGRPGNFHGRTASRCWLELPGEIVERATRFAHAQKVTPFMVLFSALAIALHKWTRQQDMVIGTVVAGRNHIELENAIGCFMNFLPFRLKLTGEETGKELLQKVRRTVLASQAHQDCPFGKIVEAIRPARDENRNPLYNVALLWQNFPAQAFRLLDLAVRPIPLATRNALLDLRFEAEQIGERWVICCEYKSSLFNEKTIVGLLNSYSLCISRLIETPGLPIEQISSEGERRRWLGWLKSGRGRKGCVMTNDQGLMTN